MQIYINYLRNRYPADWNSQKNGTYTSAGATFSYMLLRHGVTYKC